MKSSRFPQNINGEDTHASPGSRRRHVGQVRRVEEVLRRSEGGTPSHHTWLELSPSAESAATAATTASTSTNITAPASPTRRIRDIENFPDQQQPQQHEFDEETPRMSSTDWASPWGFENFPSQGQQGQQHQQQHDDDEEAPRISPRDSTSPLFLSDPTELECPRASRTSVSELAAFYEKVDYTKKSTKRPELVHDDEEAPLPFPSAVYEEGDAADDDRKPAANKSRWSKSRNSRPPSEMGHSPRVLPGVETVSVSSPSPASTSPTQRESSAWANSGDSLFDQSSSAPGSSTYPPSTTSGLAPPSMQSQATQDSGPAPPSMQSQVGSQINTEVRIRPPPQSMLPQPEQNGNSPASTPSNSRRGWSPSIPTFHGILEATLVTEDENPVQPPVYDAVHVPIEEPLPWWKRNQKYLCVGLGCLLIGALGATVGLLLLGQGKDDEVPTPLPTPAPSPASPNLQETTTSTSSTMSSKATEGVTPTQPQPDDVPTVSPVLAIEFPTPPPTQKLSTNPPSTSAPQPVPLTEPQPQSQPPTLPTMSSIQNPSSCTNTPGFKDKWGDGCEFYQSPANRDACSAWGMEGDPGMTPNENCCICKIISPSPTYLITTIPPASSRVPTSPPNDMPHPTRKPSVSPSSKPTKFPTQKPTQLPTGPTYCIDIHVQTDDFADLFTGFKLTAKTEDGSTPTPLFEFAVGTLDREAEYNKQECVSEGTYELTVYGNAEYSASIDGEEILFGRSFHPDVVSHDILAGYKPALSGRESEWLNQHNIRREAFHKEHNKDYRPLHWSPELAKDASKWVDNLLLSCTNNIEPGVAEGQNISAETQKRGERESQDDEHPGFVLTVWSDNEANVGWPDNDSRTQVLWRSTRQVGCADKSKLGDDGSFCHISVCRYSRPGNCAVQTYGTWIEAVLDDHTNCGPVCPKEGCH